MNNITNTKALLTSTLLLTLIGCGGSSSSTNNNKVKQGQFKDANVVGLEYSSKSSSGITGINGSYTCNDGELVTFKLGAIGLGSVPCGTLTTPIELISDGSIENQSVINMVKFLTMIDEDGESSNGMNISKETRALAQNWSSIDFSSSTFDEDENVVAIINELNAQGKTTSHILPNTNSAKEHLSSTLMCAYSGAYEGKFTGDDKGGFGALISATDGTMIIVGYSETFNSYFRGKGNKGFTLNTVRNIKGTTTEGTLFNGNLTSVNLLSGNWTNNSDKGTFSGQRIGSAANAKYRFVGNYEGDITGLFSFDIDTNNKITGLTYNIADDEKYSIKGVLEGDKIKATTNEGSIITATFDKATNSISDTKWSNSSFGVSGTFTGSGCKLN